MIRQCNYIVTADQIAAYNFERLLKLKSHIYQTGPRAGQACAARAKVLREARAERIKALRGQ